jgi:hypothetical protein
MNIDSIKGGARRGAGECRAEQRDLVSAAREPAECFVEVRLRAAGLRVGPILPVDDVDTHGR